MSDPRIILRVVPGEMPYRVTVEPAPAGQDLGGWYADHRAAYGYCSGLRMTHRWPIVDETNGGAK